jgi:hypothetical protein
VFYQRFVLVWVTSPKCTGDLQLVDTKIVSKNCCKICSEEKFISLCVNCVLRLRLPSLKMSETEYRYSFFVSEGESASRLR